MLNSARVARYTYTIQDAKQAILDAEKLLDVEDIGNVEDYDNFQLLLQEFLFSCAGECLEYYRDAPGCTSPELARRVTRRVSDYVQSGECPYEMSLIHPDRVYQFVSDIVIDLIAAVYQGCRREYHQEDADTVYGRTLALLEHALSSQYRLSL